MLAESGWKMPPFAGRRIDAPLPLLRLPMLSQVEAVVELSNAVSTRA